MEDNECDKTSSGDLTEEMAKGYFYQMSGRFQQRLLIILICILAAAFFYHFTKNNLMVNDGLIIEKNHAESLEFKINPNSATWQQLAQLPGIGPQKANDIVSYRQQNDKSKTVMVFKSPYDLTQVNGIGIKTVQSISQYLEF